MPEIQVRIEEAPNDSLKIAWSQSGLPFEAYLADKGLMVRAADRVRAALQTVVNEAPTRPCGDLLKALAQEGERLYLTLFPPGSAIGKEVRAWLQEDMGEERHDLVVNVPPRVHLPWGLVYSGDPDTLAGRPEDTDIALFTAFWCLQYSLSPLYYKIKPVGIKQRRGADSFRVLPVVNRATLGKVQQALPKVKPQVTRFFETLWPAHYSRQDLITAWRERRNKVDLLYFYCHADGTALALEKDLISVDDFHLEFTRDEASREHPPCVVFLNACDTAVGDLHGGFLEATGGPGYCGFIGTEARIPEGFALEFGLAFFEKFYAKRLSIGEAMDSLRQEFWPRSLIFAVSCPSCIAIDAAAAAQPAPTGS